jgi:hypothetical protein
LAIIAPHFRHPQSSVNGQFIQRRAGNIYLEHQVRRRVNAEVKLFFPSHLGFVLDIKKRISPSFFGALFGALNATFRVR